MAEPVHVRRLTDHEGQKLEQIVRRGSTGSVRYASWANPIEAHFGSLRQFTIANSHHPNHNVQTRALHACLRWRNANARHPDVLAAQRRERVRIRSEKGIRWGGGPLPSRAERSDESMRSQPEGAAEHRTDESLARTA